MDLGSTTVAIIGIILVTYGIYFGDFVAALILGGLLAVLSIKLVYKTALDLTVLTIIYLPTFYILSPNIMSNYLTILVL